MTEEEKKWIANADAEEILHKIRWKEYDQNDNEYRHYLLLRSNSIFSGMYKKDFFEHLSRKVGWPDGS